MVSSSRRHFSLGDTYPACVNGADESVREQRGEIQSCHELNLQSEIKLPSAYLFSAKRKTLGVVKMC